MRTFGSIMQIEPPRSEEDLKKLMRDDRYWQSGHPEFTELRNIVAAGFDSLNEHPKPQPKTGTGGLVEGVRRYRAEMARKASHDGTGSTQSAGDKGESPGASGPRDQHGPIFAPPSDTSVPINKSPRKPTWLEVWLAEEGPFTATQPVAGGRRY